MSDEPVPPGGEIIPFSAAPSGGEVFENLPPMASPVEAKTSGSRDGKSPTNKTPAKGTGATAPDPDEAFESKPGRQEYFYEESTGRFWLKNTAGKWIDLNLDGLKRHLKKHEGLRHMPAPGQIISAMDERISMIEQDFRVAFAGLLAGNKAGLQLNAGRQILVSEDPVFIDPVHGEWPILKQFFDGLFVGREPVDDVGNFTEIDQRPHFYAWLQHAVQCFRDSRTDTGLALLMAGEPDCGKSFLALVLRWIFGGRVARPYDAMIGKEQFNRDIAEAVLQLVDDDNQADTRLEARLKFGGELKKIVANNEFRMRGMHKDGFAVEVLRRLVVLVNLQLSRLMVLPPLDGDVNDKAFLFKGYTRPTPAGGRPTNETPAEQACWPAPMPTRTIEERERYRNTVRAELPAFLFWLLNEFKMPSQMSGGRFVVRHWHHPALVRALQDLAPEMRLWELILRSQCVLQQWKGTAEQGVVLEWRSEGWTGSASDLEVLLKSEASKLSKEEHKEIPKPNWLGQRLQSFAEHYGPNVCARKDGRTKRIWTLKPRAEDREG